MGLKQKKRAIGAVRVVVVCFLMTSLGPIDISSRCGKFNMPEMGESVAAEYRNVTFSYTKKGQRLPNPKYCESCGVVSDQESGRV